METLDDLLTQLQRLSGIAFDQKAPIDSSVTNRLFTECFQQVVPLESNNIANIIEIQGILKDLPSLVKEAKRLTSIKVPKWSDAWLFWRYQYTTTMADIRDHLNNFTNSVNQMKRVISGQRSKYHARTTTTTKDGRECIVTLTVVLQPRLVNFMGCFWNSLNNLGLQPNLVNMWDLVPLSFVIDWFLPVADVLEKKDFEFNYNEQTYSIVYATRSTKTSWGVQTSNANLRFTQYVRKQEAASYVYEPDPYDPSGKTILKRVVDGVAMLSK